MSKITVTKSGFVVAVYFNDCAKRGEMIARMAHPGRGHRFAVESAD